MSEYDKERERILKRRDELGDDEIRRRMKLYQHAHEICQALVRHPNVAEVEPMLKLAEELHDRIHFWMWGK